LIKNKFTQKQTAEARSKNLPVNRQSVFVKNKFTKEKRGVPVAGQKPPNISETPLIL